MVASPEAWKPAEMVVCTIQREYAQIETVS
jgi:hypothetical protein